MLGRWGACVAHFISSNFNVYYGNIYKIRKGIIITMNPSPYLSIYQNCPVLFYRFTSPPPAYFSGVVYGKC